MKPRLKTIIFDYGGVICTTRRSRQFADWLNEKYGVAKEEVISKFDVESWEDYNIGKSSAEECYKVFQDLGIPLSTQELRDKFASFGHPNPKMKELVLSLKRQGYDLAMLSDSVPELTEVIRAEFPETFRVEVFSEEVGMRKPYPEIYNLALQLIGNPADRCLFIDDKEKNLVYPREIGVHVHLFQSIDGLVEDLKKYN